jgi:hypothetical protein
MLTMHMYSSRKQPYSAQCKDLIYYYGMVKPLPIMLGKAPSEPVRSASQVTLPNIMGKNKAAHYAGYSTS